MLGAAGPVNPGEAAAVLGKEALEVGQVVDDASARGLHGLGTRKQLGLHAVEDAAHAGQRLGPGHKRLFALALIFGGLARKVGNKAPHQTQHALL